MIARGISRLRRTDGRSRASNALLASAALCALLAATHDVRAQSTLGQLGANVSVPSDTQLFLEADTVTYDRKTGLVVASGGVQVNYGSYKLVSRDIVYDQKSRRLVASGDVELIEPSGNKIYADTADITDDFAAGFVKALRIETPDNTRFAAAEAVRQNGDTTTFEQGVYTACEACREHPERPPLWQVKARRIVWDQKEKVVRYYGAQFEFFGAPIAYLPYFASPDPTVKRKSGFLAPDFKSSDKTGFGLRIPYYFVTSDSSDLTVAGTYYTKQGFLGEAEYRQATENGYFTLQTAGIAQRDPESFDDYRSNGVDGVRDVPDVDRGMIGTTGRFALDDRWTFGWDVLAQTDSNFSAAYDINNFDDTYRVSEVYLTGLGTQSFFDLRAQKFDVQTRNTLLDDIQPYALPVLDYEYIDEDPIFGGQGQIDVNFTNIHRGQTDSGLLLICDSDFLDRAICNRSNDFPFRDDYFRRNALEGDYTRGTTEASWERTFTTDFGLQLTPLFAARGDLYSADMSIDGYTAEPFVTDIGGYSVDEGGARGMVTGGLEARYPYLIETATTSHVIEPIAQLLVRPNEMETGELPNEDAQSLVFNASNLFQRDKFSGYDRIEGGTRANVGVQYAGVFGAGYTIDALVGESFHLAGENPYADFDLALVGAESGLETDRSDYVSAVNLATPYGISFGAQGRFDQDSLELKRADFSGGYNNGRFSTSVTYSEISAQPLYSFPEDRQQVTTSASLKLTDTITTFGTLGYDIENTTFIQRSFGVGYADECFSLIAEYSNTSDRYESESTESKLLFKIGLRTLVDTQVGYGLGSTD